MDLKQKLLAKKTPEEIEQERMDALDPFRQPDYNPDAVDEIELEVPVEQIASIKARPAPVEPVLTAEQLYQANLGKQQSEIDALSAQRRQAEAQGEADLLASEENYRENSLAKGLMGAGKSLSQTLGAINKADVSGAVTGFDSGVAGLVDSEKQNRSFIKDRLSRADQPFRSLTDSQIASQRAQTNAQAGVEAPMEIGKKRIGSELLEKKAGAESDLSKASRMSKAIELRQAARTAEQNKDIATARSLRDFAKNVEDGKLSQSEIDALNKLTVAREEDKSLEWFKALTQRKAIDDKGGNDKIDKDVTKYSQTLEKSNIPRAYSQLEQIHEKMPKTGDIPGYGEFAGMLPDFAVSKEGKDLRQSIQTLFNIELKDRSGASVTDQELQRLKKEFGEGTWKSADQLRKGIAAYERRLAAVMKNINAGVAPAVIDEYKARGGEDFAAKASTNPASSGRIKAPSANDLPDL